MKHSERYKKEYYTVYRGGLISEYLTNLGIPICLDCLGP